jgi:hypothetical protein
MPARRPKRSNIFELHEMADCREPQYLRQHARPRHQERRRKFLRFFFRILPLWFAMTVKNEMCELMHRIEAAVFGGFLRIEKYERRFAVPHRKSVYLAASIASEKTRTPLDSSR